MKIFGMQLDKRAVRVILIFFCACLIIAGHFITSATAAPAGDITLVRGSPDDIRLSGGGDVPGDADGAGADVVSGEEGGNGYGNNGGDAGSGHAEQGGGPESVNAAGVDSNGGAGTNGGQATGGVDGGPGAQAVRDGYSVPGGINSGPVAEQDRIYVYVTGAVVNPGVYALARSSMVIDAVELAGGFTDQADAENVNMVYRLESNAMLNIKRKLPQVQGALSASAGAEANAGGSAAAAGNMSDADNPNKSELYGGAVEIAYNYDGILMTGDNAAEDAEGTGARRVNINTASAEELATLPGIGKATADSIIAYRGKQKFTRIEDLMKVSGIKQAKFDAVKELISC